MRVFLVIISRVFHSNSLFLLSKALNGKENGTKFNKNVLSGFSEGLTWYCDCIKGIREKRKNKAFLERRNNLVGGIIMHKVDGIIAKVSKHGVYKTVYIPTAVSHLFEIKDIVIVKKISQKK